MIRRRASRCPCVRRLPGGRDIRFHRLLLIANRVADGAPAGPFEVSVIAASDTPVVAAGGFSLGAQEGHHDIDHLVVPGFELVPSEDPAMRLSLWREKSSSSVRARRTRSGVVGLRRRVSVGRGGTARRTPMYDVVAVRCGPRESLPRCDGSNRLVDRPGRRRHHHCCVHRRARPRNSTRARASRRQDCAKDRKNYSGAGKPNQSISVHRRLDAARQTHTVRR